MRFLSDMGISLDVTVALRQMEHDTKHLREENLQRMPDDEIIEKSSREDRIILTHDLDFGRLLALGKLCCPSIITFRLTDMRPANVLAHLLPAIARLEKELLAGAAVTITDHAVRWRSLPF